VGSVTSARLSKLGIFCVKDLLEHYPFRFEDYSAILSPKNFEFGKIGTVFGTIEKIETKKTSKLKMHITQAEISDEQGTLRMVWFNQPYIAETLKIGDKIAVAGKIDRDFDGWILKNPSYEKAETPKEAIHTSRLVPIYSLTYGLTQKQVRFLAREALGAVTEMSEIIPEHICKIENLMDKQEAVKNAHLPKDAEHYLRAIERLKFEELFITQLISESARKNLEKEKAPLIKFNKEAIEKFVNSLSFKLTDDQKKCAWQCIKDMEKPKPMNRLLQGEVGSGKTMVAAIIAINAAESEFQTAIMAPTEILALQHYDIFKKNIQNKKIALLTNKYSKINESQSDESIKSKEDIKKEISEGRIDIIIGTHAIIQKDVAYDNLGLIIIDEQHRFGVEQRKALKDKSPQDVPHLLSMTATPIPRSLSLTVYGDLDISTIKQIPIGRKKIITKLSDEKDRKKIYEFAEQKISQGIQVFVVCPAIEESDKLGVKSATKEYEKLKEIFTNRKIGLLHGKMKSEEKEKAMLDFKNKNTDILVSTSVIEVGVDVPNANIMIIEGSDRFGLSQLHQFRGRVGRGEHESFCFIFTHSKAQEAKNRILRFLNAKDGFEIAELDLELRGPGQLYGTIQSGRMETLKIATFSDFEIIKKAKKYAKELTEDDSTLLKYPNLKFEIEKQEKQIHFE